MGVSLKIAWMSAGLTVLCSRLANGSDAAQENPSGVSIKRVNHRARRAGMYVVATLFAQMFSTQALAQERQWRLGPVTPLVWH
jgi:hypothetical protein